MSKYIVAENATWKMKSGSAPSANIKVTGTYDKITINGNKVYAGTLSATVSGGYTGANITNGDGATTAPGTKNGNCQYDSCPLGKLALEDIEIPVVLIGTKPTSSGNVTVTDNDYVIVDQIKQNVVKGE